LAPAAEEGAEHRLDDVLPVHAAGQLAAEVLVGEADEPVGVPVEDGPGNPVVPGREAGEQVGEPRLGVHRVILDPLHTMRIAGRIGQSVAPGIPKVVKPRRGETPPGATKSRREGAVIRVVLASTLSALLTASLPLASADEAPRERELTKGPGPARVAFTADGKTLATGSGREVKLWDPATGKLIRALAGHELPVRAVAFAPNGRSLATAAGENRDGKLAGELKVWDAMTGERRYTLGVESSDFNAVAFSPDGRWLVAGGHRGLWVWDAAAGDLKHRAPSSAAVLAVAFAPDGGSFGSGSFDQSARLWDAKTWAERRVLKGHRSEVQALAIAPDGKTLAAGGV